jgi:tRNA A37 threonylcarbamoyladenosine synthetase subunit TsaC/SUA5/YrdC
MMLLKIYPDNPQERLVQTVVSVLEKGGIVIYTTESVYGMGCSIDFLS